MTEARVAPVLARIVAGRRAWIAGVDPAARARLGAQAQAAPPARDFRGALERPGVSLIAECKARSPSAGTLQDPYDPVTLARRYEAAGASALSVLTEPDFFGGAHEHLRAVRAAVAMPLLCKDFVVDELLVTCARAAGADAALLIVAILDDAQLHSLHAAIRAAGMQALIEAHTEAELERALEIPGAMIGINNRDLSTMRTDPGTTARLRPRIPPDRFVVSESGIRSAAEIDALAALGVGAALVGESLLRAPDLEAQMRRLRR